MGLKDEYLKRVKEDIDYYLRELAKETTNKDEQQEGGGDYRSSCGDSDRANEE
jgi:hypothetical protein